MPKEKKARQRIQFLRTPDGVQLAWAEAGSGPTLIKASNWLSHLEYEWESPLWRHWIRFFSDYFRLVRYDERGCGMSDWNVGDVSCSHWADDLESIADAALPQGAFALLGISQRGGDVHRLRGEAPATRVAAHPVRRLRPRLGAARRPRRQA